MKRLVELMTPDERVEHIERGLDFTKAVTPDSAELTKKVRSFIENKVFIKDELVAKWEMADEVARSRMIGEIKWRVTCIHEASETAVQGVMKFNLGYGFNMAAGLVDGKSCYVIQ
jgi:hypothetical protein